MSADLKPDLDSADNITLMVDRFYEALLNDELMAPLFLEVAKVDLADHLPTISQYWQKMLLGDKTYKNNTMAKHRAINKSQAFTKEHYQTWLDHFSNTAERHFSGPYTDKALNIARNVVTNMKKQFLVA